MNWYEEKQQLKKERYAKLATKARQDSEQAFKEASKMVEKIPLGQPILIGHYSERKDRNYRAQIENKMAKSIKLNEKSNYFEAKAKNESMAISSDDPDAIHKLTAKLGMLEHLQTKMIQENKEGRKNNVKPFPAWALNNNRANIRRIKKRVKIMERLRATVARPEICGNGFVCRENKEINRIQFIFNDIPTIEIRTELKSRGFRWSPREKAWQAFLTQNGKYQANRIINVLNKL